MACGSDIMGRAGAGDTTQRHKRAILIKTMESYVRICPVYGCDPTSEQPLDLLLTGFAPSVVGASGEPGRFFWTVHAFWVEMV